MEDVKRDQLNCLQSFLNRFGMDGGGKKKKIKRQIHNIISFQHLGWPAFELRWVKKWTSLSMQIQFKVIMLWEIRWNKWYPFLGRGVGGEQAKRNKAKQVVHTVFKKHLEGGVESESLPWPIQQFVSQPRLAASEWWNWWSAVGWYPVKSEVLSCCKWSAGLPHWSAAAPLNTETWRSASYSTLLLQLAAESAINLAQ